MKTGYFVAIAGALVAAGLSGCISPETVDPAEGLTYGSVDDLREAYEAAGGDCSSWEQANQVTAAAESGMCDSNTVLSIYTSTSDRDGVVAGIRSFGDVLSISLLVGANWIINSPDASDVRDSLGGTLVTTTPSE